MKKGLICLLIPVLMSPTVEDKKSEALAVHNEARKAVGQAPLKWSDDLEKDAQVYANYLAKRDKGLVHDKDNTDGENIYMSSYFYHDSNGEKHYFQPDENYLKSASEAWLSEREEYRYQKVTASNYHGTGHYTQMIWSTTQFVGIASAVSPSGSIYVVARYNPPGNWLGAYPYKR